MVAFDAAAVVVVAADAENFVNGTSDKDNKPIQTESVSFVRRILFWHGNHVDVFRVWNF